MDHITTLHETFQNCLLILRTRPKLLSWLAIIWILNISLSSCAISLVHPSLVACLLLITLFQSLSHLRVLHMLFYLAHFSSTSTDSLLVTQVSAEMPVLQRDLRMRQCVSYMSRWRDQETVIDMDEGHCRETLMVHPLFPQNER